jgi:ATP-binding cassette subfamily B protein
MARVKYSDITVYKRLLSQARPYWPHITGILFLNLLSTPLTLLSPLPLKIVVDNAIGSLPLSPALDTFIPDAVSRSDTVLLVFAVCLLILITLFLYLRGFAGSLLETYTGEKLVLIFRAKLFHCVQRLSLSYHDMKGVTDSTYRIQYDAPSIQWIAVQGVIPFITAILTLTGMIYVTARIDLQLAVVALTVAPLLFLITHLFRHRLRSEWTKVKEIESFTMTVVQEVLAALRVVKAFGQEKREKERFLRYSQKNLQGQVRLAYINGAFDILIGITIAAGTAAALYIGVRHVQSGILTLGNLLIVMAYLAQLYSPLQTMSKRMTDLQASMASAERALTLLDKTQDVVEKPGALPLKRASGAIEFRDVSFGYTGTQPVLSNISFKVAPRSRIGIVGATGAGKTTLISLLIRFYDPSSGTILLDDIDIRDCKLTDFRRQFTIVQQETVLFSTSIGENISYARPEADQNSIIKAAKLASAHDFISSLPDGYQTYVGERGMTLSGGERQRIALARAFLKDAPVLILDEPTSSVDIRTEAAIIHTLGRLMNDRTTFIISHRLSTLDSCDVLLIIKEGRLTTVTTDIAGAIKDLEIFNGNVVSSR